MMEELNELFNITGGIVTTILLPLSVCSCSMIQRSARRLRKRERRKLTISPCMLLNGRNCTRKKEHRVVELDSKIDQLYAEKNEDRQRIRELIEKNTTLEIEKIKLEAKRCDVRGCSGRKPPSDY